MKAMTLLSCLLVATDAPAPSAPPATKAPPAYKVLFVVDADTVVLRVDGRSTRIKLLGVERSGAVGEAAAQTLGTRVLRELLDGQSVRIRLEPVPPRMQVAGSVAQAQVRRAADGLWINREMIASGYAISGRYPFKDSEEFLVAEAEARAARRGLWSPEEATEAEAESERIRTEKQSRAAAAAAQREEERQRRVEWRRALNAEISARERARERDNKEWKEKLGKGYCKACGKYDWGACIEK